MSGERPPKTAAELLEELRSDRAWVARRDADEAGRRESVQLNEAEAGRVLEDVKRRTGVGVERLRDLAARMTPGIEVVLLDWLGRAARDDVKMDLIHLVGGEWGRPEAARPLLREFEAAPRTAAGDRMRWAVAAALARVADDSVVDDLTTLVLDPRSGQARQMLVLALGNTGASAAIPVLIEMLGDDEVNGHAVVALAALGAKDTRGEIEKLLDDPRAWVRREVRRALAELK